MYENGRQINRYANKMIHKRKMKRKFLEGGYISYAGWDSYVAHSNERTWLEYWKYYYISGTREFARRCTRRKIRAGFRQDLARLDVEDMFAPQRGQYKKFFDYAWTVW